MNVNNAIPDNPPEPTPKNNNNTPKVDTVFNEETIQDEEGFEFQVNSPLPAEKRLWEASQRHGLRPLWQPSFEHRYPSDHYTNLMVHVFTQLELKQGLRIFGNEGMKATNSEMQQIHNKVVFRLIKGKQLIKKQKNRALQVLMFFKTKTMRKNKRLCRCRRTKAKRRIKKIRRNLTNSSD